jgi:hypothetical protein
VTDYRFWAFIGLSLLVGYALAEGWHRISVKRMYVEQRRNALVAEFFDKQLWQFISLDEWLEKNQEL